MNKIYTASAFIGLFVVIFLVLLLTGNLPFEFTLSVGEKTPPVKIGVLYSSASYKLAFDGLKSKMAEDGYKEGEDMEFLIKELPDPNAATNAARELVTEGAAIIYSITTPVTTAVKKEVGESLPIVFNIVGDPIGPGFVKSFAEPGGNLTGCTNLSASLSGKRLEIFKNAFPHIKKVVTFYDPANAFSALSIQETRKAASGLGIEVKEVFVKNADEIDLELAKLQPGVYDGFYNTPDSRVVGRINKVVARANELKIPVMGHEEDLANRGVAITYGANFYLLGRDCAVVVENIMRGHSPRTEPVISPSKLDLVINQKTLDTIGRVASQQILSQADKIIK
ncbi:MAG: ABC transporter substrate-binding protein [Patescibacteria group bacterium]